MGVFPPILIFLPAVLAERKILCCHTMCGRFVLKGTPEELDEVVDQSKIGDEFLSPRYNIAPSQEVLVVKDNSIVAMKWGLVPHWAKDLTKIKPQINARAETASEKPFFRDAFKKSRCLIPASGFYEWKKVGEKKQPYYIHLKDDSLFFFAGLFAENNQAGETFTILTCSPNNLMKEIHNRMPVILDKEKARSWLTNDKVNLLPFDDEKMEAYPVSTFVNNPRNDSAKCIERQS